MQIGHRQKFLIKNYQNTSNRSNVHLLGNQMIPGVIRILRKSFGLIHQLRKSTLPFINVIFRNKSPQTTLPKAEHEGLSNASATSSTLRASTLGQATFGNDGSDLVYLDYKKHFGIRGIQKQAEDGG